MINIYDYPLLLAAGFEAGIADSVLWKTDKDGDKWQAAIEGDKVYFIRHTGDYRRDPRVSMTRAQFSKRFPT